MAQDPSCQNQPKRRTFKPDAPCRHYSIVAQRPTMFLHNLPGQQITCFCLVQQQRRQAINVFWWIWLSCRVFMQNLFYRIQAKVVENTLLEGRRWIDAQFRANHRIQRFLAQLGAALHLVLPGAGMPDASIRPSRSSSSPGTADDRDAHVVSHP